MREFFARLLDANFLPHGHCFFWKPEILYLHLFSDGAIAASYFSIPLALVFLVAKRRDAGYPWIFVLFASFILACGATHVFSMWTLWVPTYRLEGAVKALTAAISMVTAVALWTLIPRLLRIPSPAQLAAANADLRSEALRRGQVEARLRDMLGDIEKRVALRTEELVQANDRLQREVAERKRAEEEARRLAAIVEQTDDAIFGVDLSGVVTTWNRGAERLLGWRADEMIGKKGAALVPADRLDEFRRAQKDVHLGKHLDTFETVRLTKDGRALEVDLMMSAVSNDRGAVVGSSCICRDISARKRSEQVLRQLATTDTLTGLYNRRHFFERLAWLTAEARRYGTPLAVCMCDLDGLKGINDRLGHAAGDAALERFAALLREGLRAVDVAGRYGGDEFALALPHTSLDAAAGTLERIRRALAEAPVELEDGRAFPVSGSFGVVRLGAEGSAQDLIRAADAALYAAKNAGGSRVVAAP